jgi:hypothetical protein
MKVLSRVERLKRGTPFSIARFYTLGSRTSVQKALSRLSAEGVVERVSKGFYVRPKPLPSMPSIKSTTSAGEVAKVWAKENGYTLVAQGQEAAYRLGLQTQAPMRTILWSNGPSRIFKIGNETVEVKRIALQKLKWSKEPEGQLLRGLLVTPPQSVKLSSLKKAFARLAMTPEETSHVLHRLSSVPSLHRWENKLRQMERSVS